ncbi:DNA/RNA helicase, partial [Lactiplantibacillus pentosus]|nr:DNA/RNA helicase [Lactiplantibacillus pentosus]
MQAQELYGRQLALSAEAARDLPAGCQVLPAMQVTATQVQCQRCGSQLDRQRAQ